MCIAWGTICSYVIAGSRFDNTLPGRTVHLLFIYYIIYQLYTKYSKIIKNKNKNKIKHKNTKKHYIVEVIIFSCHFYFLTCIYLLVYIFNWL